MKNLNDAAKELMDQVIFVLDHSMDLKKDGMDPMLPFAVVVKGKESTIKTFVGDTPDYGDQMFERTIKVEKPDYIVYASDSYMTKGGIKYDAVLLNAWDSNDTEIYLIAQRFKPKTETEEFEKIGNPAFIGTKPNTFVSAGKMSAKGQKIKTKPWWKFW
jgi:hypothetical protein